MRIVDLNKLSEEERKKVLEEQQTMLEQRQQASAELQRQGNQKFNELVNKSGEYDTNKHTTTIGNIQNAYRGSSDYNNIKKSLNTFYRNNNTNSSLWEQIKERAGFTAKKTGAGILSGISGIGQGIITDTANNMKKGEKEDSNELIRNLVNSFSLQSPTDYMMKNLPSYAKKQIESLKDKDKNGIEKAVSFVNNAVSEVGNSYNNKLGVLSELVGKISPNTSEELLKANNKISEPINEINNQLDRESEKYGTVANTIANVGQAIGNMTPSILSSVITKNPNVGLATMGLSSKGQSTQEALNKGAELDKAVKIGNTKAMIEVGTEMLTGGVNIFGKGALDDIVEKGILSKVKSNVGKAIAKQGINVAGETLEETISDILGTVIDKGTVNPNAKYTLKDWGDTAITTTLTTLVLNSLGIAGDIKSISNENKANKNAQNWINEAQNIINNNTTQNLRQNTVQKQAILPTRQITQQENKTSQNGYMEQNNINEFNGYTQKEIDNIKSNKISIAQSNEDISNFVNNSRKVPGNFKMYLGKITENVSNTIKSTLGINVDNYNISLKTDDVRKIFKDHGSEKTEIPRGQVPITENDFLNIPNIINNPDIVSEAGKSPQDKPVIKFEKNINGNNVVVTYVSDKHNNLELQTMYKFKNNKKIDSATALHENQTPGLNTSEMDSGTNLIINNSIPQNKNSVKNNTITNNYAQNNENNTMNQPTQGEKINWNEIERPEGKIRKHYRSIIESGNTTKEAKAIAKELMGMDTYIPDSNNKQLKRADTRIQNSTPESELDSLMSRATTGGKIDATDIAVGEKLIQYYSLIGDKAKLQESIQATAMAGTTAGQAVQAMSLLNHQTPEGQAVWIQRSVEKMNNDLRKARGEKAQQFDFTAEMQEKIVNSKNNEELQDNLNDVYKELGQQVNKNLIEKIDSWRYFSMLGNPKTHIRNMVGNFLMGKAQDTKNKVAGVIEGTVAKFNTDMERMHTIKRASKEVIDFAKNDIKNVSDRLGLNDNKYNPKSRLENNMRTFKSDVMENTLGRLFKWNDNLLEAEDGLGLKAGYKKALSEYITANNIDVNNITDTQLSKARNYAVQQAQERTFHQANIIASAINSFFGKNKATKAIGDAVLPFVKTPANVAKTGIEYSPAGLAKSIVYDSVQLRKGNINVNQYIDNVSKGLTGSAITVLGFALAQAGILKASGSDDDKKEKFDEQSGKQAYSIQIGDNTYTIDWLAPVGIPLMVGAEIYEGLSQKSNEKKTKSSDDEDVTKQFWDRAEVLANSLSNTLDPMVEMSMISGLTSTVRSFAQGDTQALGNMLTNGAKSYINQFVPTLLGQIAKTTDIVERDTTSTKSGTISKAVDSTANQIKSKIPGLRQTLPTKKDIWGKDITLANNWPQRFFEAGILPTNSKTINKDKVVTELNNLYDKIGESSILPTTIDKTFTIDGQKYRMTNEEYNKYKTNYGQTSYKLIKNLVSSEEYGKMNDKQKQKAIENVYSYAKESNKLDYAKNNKLECEQSTLYTTMQDLKNNGGSQSEYLNYLSKITELNKDKDKNQILVDSSYTDKTKAIIYRNTTGKEDELYNNLLSKDNININEYLKYKLQEFESDRKDDGTTSGEAISGSKKKKVYSYVNNMNITREQKLILLGMQYKLSNSERTELANLINKLPNTSKDEKMKLYEKMQGFTVYKNGTIKW